MNFSDPVMTLPSVGPISALKLAKLNIHTIRDLLYHMPSRYADLSEMVSFDKLTVGEKVTIKGQLISLKNIFTKTGKVIQEGVISDGENSLVVIWFNQVYLARSLATGTQVSLSGKVGFWKRKPALVSPQWEKIIKDMPQLHTGRVVPVYPETAGVSSKWLRMLINQVLAEDSLFEEDYLKKSLSADSLELMPLQKALHIIHFPENMLVAEEARQRLAFDELLLYQITSRLNRIEWQLKHKAPKMALTKVDYQDFLDKIPFTPTKSQFRSIEELTHDLSKPSPMNRLLEGDVGSGKTLVAAAGAYITTKNGLQTVVLAPTQILAEQHAKTLSQLLAPWGINVALYTSQSKEKNTNTDIFVGTHALLHNPKLYQKVGFVIIDEQHRFGVKQRALIMSLTQKGKLVPHVLTMTATPIPRTIALTLYGELDISTLDEMPSGRKKITTWVIPPAKRDSAYGWIETHMVDTSSQAFVVCPLIDPSESETLKDVKSAKAEFDRLKTIFTKLKMALLHGKMKREEKTAVLDAFRAGKFDVLVTTPVVEVGIDIPNATIMMIEAADRFGLAQLHQLRGRVGRGEKDSYCLLMTESSSKKVKTRLKAVTTAKSGRELADIDLTIRGPGEIFGLRQSGYSELRIARWTDMDLIKLTKSFSQQVVDHQDQYPEVLAYIKSCQVAAN